MPVILGLLSIWYRNFFNANSCVLLPYQQRLFHLVDHLQQLEMESHGKQIMSDGHPVKWLTGAPVWGQKGTNCQHSFMQLFHQGTNLIPIDFIITAKPTPADKAHHDLLFANCLAQSRALMLGNENTADKNSHQLNKQSFTSCPGNRPSNTIILSQLSATSLGALTALYEHKVYVQSVIWQINAFDQWGVELGKSIAQDIHNKLINQSNASKLDPSTQGLLSLYGKLHG